MSEKHSPPSTSQPHLAQGAMSEATPQHSPPQKQIEQLDLLAFVKILWQKSGLILLFIALASALAYALTTFVVKPSWRAEAYIEAPRENELGNYYALFNMYQLVEAKPASRTIETDAAAAPSVNQAVYHVFKQQLKAYDVRRSFWQNSDYYKQQLNGDKNHDDSLLEALIGSITFVEGNARNNSNDKVELTLNNPKQAAELLNAYLTYTNLATRQVEYGNLIAKWKNLFDRVTLAVNNKLEQDQQGNLVPVSVWQSKQAMMTSVQPLDNQFSAFHYLKTPVQPLSPHSPNQMLWILAAAFSALLLGCALAVILALRRYARGE
ncbi:Wzz/FepE/Etk N-terminal domain-containing protein [Pasteurella testudinis]|uniref:Wzz/FepE/Etk N-terminal domain-containing protein n=1 Tax=Pasteurella testudinis TaxID=761 RepID=UPI004057FEB7